jgi:hypothetical protein
MIHTYAIQQWYSNASSMLLHKMEFCNEYNGDQLQQTVL